MYYFILVPLINDYNIKLTSGYESINVSWNKVSMNESIRHNLP